jgi:hypothetical protein
MEEELVDSEDSKDKTTDHEAGDEDGLPHSQESFSIEVNKYVLSSNTISELIEVKQEKDKSREPACSEEPRRCESLKSQEDAGRTDLAIKRDAQM